MAGESSWAITLPNQFESYGNIMQRGINAQNEQNQMLYSETMRDRQQAQNNEKYNINLIQEEANARELATGNTTFDIWLGSEYSKSLKEIMTLPLSTIPPAKLYEKVKSKFLPLTQTGMRLKNTIDAIDENTKAVGSEMTDIDAAALAARAKEAAIGDLMPVDKSTGMRNYMPQNFKPDKDYVADAMSSPNSWELIKDGSKFTDFIKNYKTSPISVHKQFADKSLQGYTGRQSPFKRLNVKPDENSRIKASENPQLEVDVQDDFIQDGNLSKSIKILADEPYRLIQSNDQAARGLNHLWEKYKKENNLRYDNPTENEKRKRKFAAELIETADVSEIVGQTPTHLPRTNNYINTGVGTKNAGADWVTRVMGSMKGGDVGKAKDIFSELIAGDITKLESVEDLGGGKVKIKLLPKPKYDIMGQAIQKSTEPVEKVFDVNSRTLPYELQNLYQTVMGGDAKLEKTYFAPNTGTGKKEEPKSTTTKPKSDPLKLF